MFQVMPLAFPLPFSIFAHVIFQGDTLFQDPVPEYLQGLIGTKPSSSQGTLWQDVKEKWNSLNPEDYPMAGPGTSLSVSVLG